MAAQNNHNGDEITGINITPLVDITLVLLIIFMVTATYIVSPQIKVELPKAATAENSELQTFSVVIDKDGKLYLNGEDSTEDMISQRIDERIRNTPDLQVVISADKMVYHGTVIHIVDLVRKHGVKKFAINVEAEHAEN